MKALSLRQPWGWAVINRQKTVENRRWNTHFRGEFLIQAAKGMTVDEYEDATMWMAIRCLLEKEPLPEALLRGGIIGIAEMVGIIVPNCLEPIATGLAEAAGADLRFWMREQYGFLLKNVRPLPFIPCRGALGFFEVPAEVERVAREVLAA